MDFTLQTEAIALFLVAGMIALVHVGHRLGQRRRFDATALDGVRPLEGAVYTLLGLLIAFTFSGAAGRFDERRDLVGKEVNAIGTAWLRLDMLPEADRNRIRAQFRDYVDTRLLCFVDGGLAEEAVDARRRATAMQRSIWTDTLAAATQLGKVAETQLIVQSLNDMIDVTTERLVAMMTHPPTTIYVLLFALALASALLAGHSAGRSNSRHRLHTVLFALTIAGAILVTLDVEHPRRGLIRVDDTDQLLAVLRQSFGD